jgi:hypothetical protein
MNKFQQPELANTRDDIIADIDQFIYRLRLH